MPLIRINSLKSLAINCGPLSEIILGLASGNFSLARRRMISTSDSFMAISPDLQFFQKQLAAPLAF